MTKLATSDVGSIAQSLAADVRHYLSQTPRQLPSRALYDTLGSRLFEAICHLPWYPVTRAERRLIASHRLAIFRASGSPWRLAELGCGSGEKLNLFLGPPTDPVSRGVGQVDLIDVSSAALQWASRLVGENRSLIVLTHPTQYEDGLVRVAAQRQAVGGTSEHLAVLFLGSNIGNFDPPGAERFLAAIWSSILPGDTLLIGADLVKPEAALLAAYDDPLGVTAAFNKNLLIHLNRELGATFDINRFDHRAVWNDAESRVEMHLVSRAKQRVDVPASGLSIELDEGETIWTESSYKYRVAPFEALMQTAGFDPVQRWIDEEGQFLLTVAIRRERHPVTGQ